MTNGSAHTLQRTMIIYFLLIGFASLLVGVEFIFETHSSTLEATLTANFERHAQGMINANEVFKPINQMRGKAVLMLAIILMVMVIVLTMFIKKITGPLQHMIEVSKEISKGDLSQTVRIQARNELAQLGNVINEMSSNLQETILLTQNMCSSGQAFFAKASKILDSDQLNVAAVAELKTELHHLKSELDMLQLIIQQFKFYSVEKRNDV